MKKTIIFGLIFLMLIGIVSADLSDNINTYYKYDGDATDSVGSNDGTVVGATQTSSGFINQAYDFDGTDDYIQSANAFSPSAYTVSFWFKADSTTNPMQLIDNTGTDANDGFKIYLYNSALYYRHYDGTGTNKDTDTSFSDTSSWHFVTTTWSGTSMELFLDGTSVDTQTAVGMDATNRMRIGTRPLAVPSQFFDGKIDEIGLWERVLTGTEITELYNAGAGLQYPFGGAPPPTTLKVEETFMDKQPNDVIINNNDIYSEIITAQISVDQLRTSFVDVSVNMYSTSDANVVCQVLMNNNQVMNASRTSLSGTYGNLNLLSELNNLTTGQYNMSLECKKTSGGKLTILSTNGMAHLFNSSVKRLSQAVSVPSITKADEPIGAFNFTANYTGYYVTDWKVGITNNNGAYQDIETQIHVNDSDVCGYYKRGIADGNTGSLSGACAFPVVVNSTYEISSYYTGTNTALDLTTNARVLSHANHTKISGSLTTTPTKIAELTLEDITGTNNVLVKAGVSLYDSGNTANFYFNVDGVDSDIFPKSALSESQVISLHYLFNDTSDSIVQLWGYTNTGTATINGGDFLTYKGINKERNITKYIITAQNDWNQTSINSFSVFYKGLEFVTTTGTVSLFTTQDLVDVTIDPLESKFFNKTYTNYNITNNLLANVTPYTQVKVNDYYNLSTYINTFSIEYNGDYYNTTTGVAFIPSVGLSQILTVQKGLVSFANAYNFNTNYSTTIPVRSFTKIYAKSYEGQFIDTFDVSYDNGVTISNVSAVAGIGYIPLYDDTYTVKVYNAQNSSYQFAFSTAELLANPYLEDHTFTLYTYNSINLTFMDEYTNTLITTQMYMDFIGDQLYNVSARNTTTGKYYIDLLSPDTYEIKYYDNDLFSDRSYFMTVEDQGHYDLIMYSMNISKTELITFTVDDGAVEKGGVVIKARKLFIDEGVYKTVAMCKTSYNGVCAMNLVPDIAYSFTMISGNDIINIDPFTLYNSEYIMHFVPVGQFDNINTKLNMYGNITYTNSSNNWRFDFASNNGNQYDFCLNLYNNSLGNSDSTPFSSTCTHAESGIILINQPLNDNSISAIGTVSIASETHIIANYNLDEGIKLYSMLGTFGLFMAFLIILILSLIGISASPSTGIVMACFGVLLSRMLGLFNTQWEVVTGIIVMGFVTAYLTKS